MIIFKQNGELKNTKAKKDSKDECNDREQRT